ncbi:hypothetical protein [Clostridium massiliamazoniense]|uniref:hypothetical protein n=1 Tax=Clostridium massiliamazoniense TaxID=1347366 RepID=UPI0006D7A95D|nr:hypothetical protein [Clostridium massiliamazoniense]
MAKGNLEISERDFNMLKLINKYGFIKKETLVRYFLENEIDIIYNSYVYKRIVKLQKYNYLKAERLAYGLGEKGIEYLELMGIDILYSSPPKGEKVKANYKDNDILFKMKFKNIQSRIEFLKEEESIGHSISKIKIFAGVGWNDPEEKYLIYRVEKRFTKMTLERILKDIENSYIKNIIIIADNLNQFKRYKNEFKKSKLNKALIIPNTSLGFETLELYVKGYFINENLVEFISKVAPNANAKMVNNRMEVFNEFTSNLMVLDLKKELLESNLANIQKVPSASVIFSEVYMDYFIEKDTFKINKKTDSKVTQNNRKVTLENFKEKLKISL